MFSNYFDAIATMSKASTFTDAQKSAKGERATQQTQSLQDEHDLACWGKKQRLERRFGFLSILALTCTIMITWESVLTTAMAGLAYGGPPATFWAYMLCWAGSALQIVTMAEMASLIPLSGGQYNWVAALAPRSCYKFLSYITGWLTVLAWQGSVTGGANLVAGTIESLISLNYPTYTPTNWQTLLMLWAVLGFALLVNTYLGRMLPALEGIAFICHVVGFVVVLMVVAYLGPRNPSRQIFDINYSYAIGENFSKYPNSLAFMLCLTTSLSSLLGADAAAHMAEEVRNASLTVPRAMMATVGINGVMGAAMMIGMLYACAGSIVPILNTQTPYITLLNLITQTPAATTGVSFLVLLMQIFSLIGVLATASRMTWAFARERALPGYRFLARVEPRTALPLWSVGLSAAFSVLLSFIVLGSSVALSTALQISLSGFYGSILISAGCLLYRRIQDPYFRFGPFVLSPALGLTINFLTVIWTFMGLIFTFFPSDVVHTAAEMNWGVATFVGTMLLALIFWYVHGRKVYTGPIIDRDEVKGW